MSNPENIAVVTVEWSDDYAGGELSGHFDGNGNEKFLFQPVRGKFYGYFPPNAGSFPSSKGDDPWLIFFVSRPRKQDPSVVVGWYENARIVGETARPDAKKLGKNSSGGQYSYSAVATEAVLIPVAGRDCVLPKGDSLRSFTYIREGGASRKNRTALIRILLKYRKHVNSSSATSQGTGGRFGIDQELKTKVEKAAIRAVKRDFGAGFKFSDKQKTPGAGYDLEFTDKGSGEIWCVEVKGAGGAREAFFITRTERRVGKALFAEERAGGNRRWRLAIVTRACSSTDRKITYYDADELEANFGFECLQWQAASKIDGNA